MFIPLAGWLDRSARSGLLTVVAILAPCALGACEAGSQPTAQDGPRQISIRHAKHFSVERREGLTVIRVTSGNGALDRRRTVVLVGRGAPSPQLEGDIAGAVIVRTPVRRIAINNGADEAFLVELGAAPSLVAIGGTKSYFDDLRQRAPAGEIAQLGYDWHAPPNLDLLVAARPDVFLMRLSGLRYTASLERSLSLGVPTVPTLVEDEKTYLARAEWIIFFGLLVGKGNEAQARFRAIEEGVERLKALLTERPRQKALWAYSQGADRWVAVVRGAEAQYLKDAGGENVLGDPPTGRGKDTVVTATESLLLRAPEAVCWIIGDVHAAPIRSKALLGAIRAWREGCLFTNAARFKPHADAYDWYQSAIVRPDLVLTDFVQMLHPGLMSGPFNYLGPVSKERVP